MVLLVVFAAVSLQSEQGDARASGTSLGQDLNELVPVLGLVASLLTALIEGALVDDRSLRNLLISNNLEHVLNAQVIDGEEVDQVDDFDGNLRLLKLVSDFGAHATDVIDLILSERLVSIG